MTAEHLYLIDLVRAWVAGQTEPVPMPRGVAAQAIRERLCAHNIEAALGPLLPESARPDEFLSQLELSRDRTEFLLMECERLLPAFSGPGYNPVLLKGVALALCCYERPSDRWFLDLDVLVPRSVVPDVCRKLEAAGYRELQGARDPLFYEKYHLHRIMLGPQGAVVEVHWDLTLPDSVYRHDVAGVAGRAEQSPIGSREALCAAPVDQILHGVYQNIADGFVDLRRVLDLAVILPRMNADDWTHLVAEAKNTGMARGLYLTLHIMKEISGVEFPTGVMNDLDPGRTTKRTIRGLDVVTGCLDRRASEVDCYTPMLHFLVTPGLPHRIREIFRSLWVGEAMLLDRGHRPSQLPGIFRRSIIGLRQFRTLARLTGRVVWATFIG